MFVFFSLVYEKLLLGSLEGNTTRWVRIRQGLLCEFGLIAVSGPQFLHLFNEDIYLILQEINKAHEALNTVQCQLCFQK